MDSIVNRKGPRNKKKLKAGNLIKSLPLFGALYEDGKEQKHFIKLLSSFIQDADTRVQCAEVFGQTLRPPDEKNVMKKGCQLKKTCVPTGSSDKQHQRQLLQQQISTMWSRSCKKEIYIFIARKIKRNNWEKNASKKHKDRN